MLVFIISPPINLYHSSHVQLEPIFFTLIMNRIYIYVTVVACCDEPTELSPQLWSFSQIYGAFCGFYDLQVFLFTLKNTNNINKPTLSAQCQTANLAASW